MFQGLGRAGCIEHVFLSLLGRPLMDCGGCQVAGAEVGRRGLGVVGWVGQVETAPWQFDVHYEV